MASNMKKVASQIYEGLRRLAETPCDFYKGGCAACDAKDLCKGAMDLRSLAKCELDKGEKPEVSTIQQPEKPEADQRKNLCEALTDTVNKLHGMMEHAIKEESLETVLDISGQIIDCAECIVKLQSGMVDVKLLEELMRCQEEAEGEDA